MERKEWLEGDEVLPFTQLMFIVGKAMKIHPWDMQEAIEKSAYEIGDETTITRLGDLRASYNGLMADRRELPSFETILEKVAWIVAAPDEASPPDDYLSRLNCAIDEYSRNYLSPEERIHKRQSRREN